MNKPKLIIDADIIIDFFRNKSPFYENAKEILDSVFEKKYEAIMCKELWEEYQLSIWHETNFDRYTSNEIENMLNKIAGSFNYEHLQELNGNNIQAPKYSNDLYDYDSIINLTIQYKPDFLITRSEVLLEYSNNPFWTKNYFNIQITTPESFTKEIAHWQDQNNEFSHNFE